MKTIHNNLNFLPHLSVKKFSKCIVIFCFLQTIGFAATRTSTATGGNWNSTSTWSTGVIPLAGDQVVIATTGTNAVTVDGMRTCIKLTINSRGRLIISGTNTLTVNGAISMPRPGNGYTSELNVNGGTLNATGLFTIGGTSGTRYATLNITTGTANLAGLTTSGVASRIIFAGTGILNMSGVLTGVSHTLTVSQGTVNFTSPAAQNIWTKTYYNLGVSGAGAKNLSASTTVNNRVQVDGTLNLSSYTLTLPGAGTPLIVNGTLNPGSGTVAFTGTTGQTVAGTTYYNLVFSNAGTKTIPTASSASVSNDFNVGSSALFAGTSTVTVGRDITGAGTITMGSGTLTIGRNNTRTGVFVPGSGTVHYAGTAAQTVRAVEYFNLKLSLAGNKSVAADQAIVINNDLDVNSQFALPGAASADIAGSVIGTGNIILQGGVISLEGDWMNEGNLESGSSTIIFDGIGDQIVAGNDYYNLETGEGGTKTLSDVAVVRNILTVGANSELDLDSHDLTLSGAGIPLVNNGIFSSSASTVNYTNAGATEIAAVNYHNLNAAGGPRKLAEAGSIGISGTFTPGAGVYEVINSTVSFNGVNQTLPPFTFYDVVLTGAGVKLIDSEVNVKTLAIENGAILNLQSDDGGVLTVTD